MFGQIRQLSLSSIKHQHSCKDSQKNLLQTFLQVPAACQFFNDVFSFKMFRANYSCFSDKESVLSMLAFDQVAPSIPSLDFRGKPEEVVTCEKAFLIVVTIVTVNRGTMLSSLLRRRRRSIPSIGTLVHLPKLSI